MMDENVKTTRKKLNDVWLLHFERIYVSECLTFSSCYVQRQTCMEIEILYNFAHIYVTCLLCSISVCNVSLLA